MPDGYTPPERVYELIQLLALQHPECVFSPRPRHSFYCAVRAAWGLKALALCRRRAQLIDLTETLGTPPTQEGRHIFALKISDNAGMADNAPAMPVGLGPGKHERLSFGSLRARCEEIATVNSHAPAAAGQGGCSGNHVFAAARSC